MIAYIQYPDFFIMFLIYENKIQLKTFSRIYKCIDIQYNTILLKNKAF